MRWEVSGRTNAVLLGADFNICSKLHRLSLSASHLAFFLGVSLKTKWCNHTEVLTPLSLGRISWVISSEKSDFHIVVNVQYLSIFLRWGIMYIIYIFRTIVLIFVAMFIVTFRPLYAPAFFRWLECLYPLCHVSLRTSVYEFLALVRSSDIPKRVSVQYPVKSVENFQRGN